MQDRRIWDHPILSWDRGNPVGLLYNGQRVTAYSNETVAAALYAAGVLEFTRSSYLHRPRGPFCMIGKCSQCMMRVDGVPHVRTCILPVEDGMVIESEEPHSSDYPTPRYELKVEKQNLSYDFVIVGAGPAGLSAALAAAPSGMRIAVLDQSPYPGGQLIKQTHKFFGTRESFAGTRGIDIARNLVSQLKEYPNVELYPMTQVIGYYPPEGVLMAVRAEGVGRFKVMMIRADKLLVAAGAMERTLAFPGNDLPGVMGAGAAQTLMNVFGIKPANDVLIIGAGNVGVIVAYQARQAGINVRAVIDILPKTAAYLVHAAKIRRMQIPVFMEHTIKGAYGDGSVESAVIYQVDKSFKPVEGSEKEIKVDGIWMAVGLSPSTELLSKMGARMKFVPELGGYVPYRTKYLETSVRGVYVAGDASGIEEASTAMMEGRIAGISAAISAGKGTDSMVEERRKAIEWLDLFRESPDYRRIKEGISKVLIQEAA
ncbi:MAG: FAD-dependent oxidoreductase [Conexivisphaera sp.]